MGIIKAVQTAIGGGLADQWLEVIEPYSMGDHTVLTRGGIDTAGTEHQGNR